MLQGCAILFFHSGLRQTYDVRGCPGPGASIQRPDGTVLSPWHTPSMSCPHSSIQRAHTRDAFYILISLNALAYSPILEISDPLIQRRPRYWSEDAFVSGRWRVMISTSA
jgi:hypothetical protein